MVSIAEIEEMARRIGREFGPRRVVLFGSYAYGTPTPDSDVDIFVEIRHAGRGWRVAGEIRRRIRPSFPVDLVIRTPEEVRERLALGDCFIREVVERGRVLYESPDR